MLQGLNTAPLTPFAEERDGKTRVERWEIKARGKEKPFETWGYLLEKNGKDHVLSKKRRWKRPNDDTEKSLILANHLMQG